MAYQVKILGPREVESYDQFVKVNRYGSFLQTSAWAKVKEQNGWTSQIVTLFMGDRVVAGAQIFTYRMPLGRRLSYIPYGPIWDDSEKEVLPELLRALEKNASGFALRIELNRPFDPAVTRQLEEAGFRSSGPSLQPDDSIILDLSQSEEEILSGLRQTTRRYIRQAERAGLRVTEVGESGLGDFYEVMTNLSKKLHFGIHGYSYYEEIWRRFPGQARLFSIFQGNKTLGSYFLIASGDKSWELYGGVYLEAQEMRAAYLLKWEVIKAMKASGVTLYDQWGVAPEGDTQHELSGVTYFKEGFGGERVHYVGAYDKSFETLSYIAFSLANRLRGLVR